MLCWLGGHADLEVGQCHGRSLGSSGLTRRTCLLRTGPRTSTNAFLPGGLLDRQLVSSETHNDAVSRPLIESCPPTTTELPPQQSYSYEAPVD